VVRSLVTAGAGIPGFKTALVMVFSKTFSIHPLGNGYLALFREGQGEGREEEE